LNRNGKKFDWENDDLTNLETIRTEDKLVHPDFIAEIPGIETEADYEDIVGPQSASQGHKPTVAQRVAAARQSAGRGKNVTATPRGVDDDDASGTQSVIDLTDDDLFLSGLPASVKQEMVDEESVNQVSDGGVYLPAQEVVNEDSVNHISDGGVDLPGQEIVNEDAEPNDAPQDGGVRRGRRNRTPREMYEPSMQGKSYARGKYEGVGFPTVKKQST
jgi:hypothetical protein